MNHLLNEEQRANFHARMRELFCEFRENNRWTLTEHEKEIYITGIVDFCDALIYANDHLTYDVATLRNATEENLEEIAEGE